MSTAQSPEVRPPYAEGPGGDWIFPLSETATTTRAALVSGASALSLVLLAVLAAIGVVLAVTEPGSIVPWMPLALIPLAAGSVAAWRWEPITTVGYVAIALAAIGSFIALTIAAYLSPAQAAAGTAGFVLSMTTNVAVLTGAASDRWTGGIAGALGGYALGEGTIAITAAVIGLPYRVDVPPIAIALGVALGYAVVPLARARARSGTASLEQADRRTRARRLREVEGRESIAVLHDTLLGELATLAVREPGPLSDAERDRLAASLESSAMLPLLRNERIAVAAGVGAWLVSIGAAGGIRIRLEGDVASLDDVAEPAGSALRSALEQCVVNVARHAGVAEAWVAVGASDAELSVTVVDEGVGFDPDAVPHDRLGLSESVRGRVERCGGTVRVWSSPGAGTSVHIVVPVEA
jgi:signal transduction histidine kinase